MLDTHIHTDISFDGIYSVDDYVREAKGFDGLIITDHYDIFDGVDTHDERTRNLGFDDYRKKMTAAKSRYGDFVRCGIELGLRPDKEAEIKASRELFDFDYVIGSAHIICGHNISHDTSFFDGKTKKEAYTEHLDELYRDVLMYHDYFDALGHLDYIVRYGVYEDNRLNLCEFGEKLDGLFNLLIDCEIALEVNTSGYRRELGMPHPHFELIKRYRELGGKLFVLGSDAHTTDVLGYEFKNALNVMREAGVKEICTYNKRKKEFTKI